MPELADAVAGGDRQAIARALNLVDDRRPEAQAQAAELLAALEPRTRAHLIGLTGPPGSGKSSLASALLDVWRASGRTVGVLAVDPSSPRTGGALLGDRLRMMRAAPDDGVFIRSLASRGELGGLAPEVWPMAIVLGAAHDLVLIETVGIGQSEIDVADVADTTCLVVQPASGDTIQFLKAGIMEIPHLFVVSKADLGVIARRTARELESAVPGRPVLQASATQRTGIHELAAAIDAHRDPTERRARLVRWVMKRLRAELGTRGIAALGGEAALAAELSHQSPLLALSRIRGQAPPRKD